MGLALIFAVFGTSAFKSHVSTGFSKDDLYDIYSADGSTLLASGQTEAQVQSYEAANFPLCTAGGTKCVIIVISGTTVEVITLEVFHN